MRNVMAMSVRRLQQVAANNRVISLLVAATVLSLIIFCSYLPSSSDSNDDGQHSEVNIELPFPPASHHLDNLIPPLVNSSEIAGRSSNNNSNPSVEVHDGINRSKDRNISQDFEKVVAFVESNIPRNLFHNNTALHAPVGAALVKEQIQDGLDISSNSKTVIKRAQITQSFQSGIYTGKWVYDDSYPLYPPGECPYMSGDFNCKANGRNDTDYTKWRWQPTDFDLPRLNATDMLERLRGKRMMFIGDSINRNQWESLLCILSTVVPQNRKYFGRSKDGGGVSFLAQDYNCSVEFFWAPFLIEQGTINVGNKSKVILRLDAIEKHGSHWRNVDILVFNSGHWWTHGNKVESKDFYIEGDYLHPQLDPLVAFQKGLATWAAWIDKNIDPAKSKVFFRGFSPTHFSSRQWNKPKAHKCNFERQPILEESYINPYPERMKMVEEVLGKMKFPVSLMNITRLSDFRKDAHPSVYTQRGHKPLTEEQRNDPDRFGDCSHWCLPGLPDIWNELLYGKLLMLAHV